MSEEQYKDYESRVLAEYEKGKIVFMAPDGSGAVSVDLNSFLDQPIDGILYDLNRSEVVVRSFIDDPKWVNDYAVCKVIRELYSRFSSLRQRIAGLEAQIEAMRNCYNCANYHGTVDRAREV